MNKIRYAFALLTLLFVSSISVSCSSNDDEEYVAPVVVDPELPIELSQVPYEKLSDYGFFQTPLKDHLPVSAKVVPFEPSSELFTDYAKKKRFIWMPSGVSAQFAAADKNFTFPVGTILIKSFYYEQVAPSYTPRIIETRILVKSEESSNQESGWHTYNYIWNEEQTEAYLDQAGIGQTVPIRFMRNGQPTDITYSIPATMECKMCHKTITENGEHIMPIGTKPQNLNKVLQYGAAQMNQLQKWIEVGYLNPNMPTQFTSTVDWKDTSKPLAQRAKSYLDINCAHCHTDGGHCDYTQIRLNFSNTDDNLWGICAPVNFWDVDASKIIYPGSAERSSIVLRMESNLTGPMMPMIGRSIVHEEGVALIREWIDQMTYNCD